MESINLAADLIAKVSGWIFNKNPMIVSALLTTALPPVMLVAALSDPDAASGGTIGLLLLAALILAPLGGFALWKTRFFSVPKEHWDKPTKVAAYASIAIGLLIAIFVIIIFIFTVLILKAAMAAVEGSFGGGKR